MLAQSLAAVVVVVVDHRHLAVARLSSEVVAVVVDELPTEQAELAAYQSVGVVAAPVTRLAVALELLDQRQVAAEEDQTPEPPALAPAAKSESAFMAEVEK